MNERIGVLIVDDHELFRRGVTEALRQSPGFAVEGEAATAREALDLARRRLPQLALVDLGLPDLDGRALIQRLHEELPVCRIVALTASEDEQDLLAALGSGAAGYLVKGIGRAELLEALTQIMRGETYVSATLASRLLVESLRPSANDPLGGLSEREREVLEGIARGERNREIAERLGLSEKTVKHYVTNVLVKLQVRSRVEAALLAQREERTRHGTRQAPRHDDHLP